MESKVFIDLEFDRIDIVDINKHREVFSSLDSLLQYLSETGYSPRDIGVIITGVVQKEVNARWAKREREWIEYIQWEKCFVDNEKTAWILFERLEDILKNKNIGLDSWRATAIELTSLMKKLKGEHQNGTLHNGIKGISPIIYGSAKGFYSECQAVFNSLDPALDRLLEDKKD